IPNCTALGLLKICRRGANFVDQHVRGRLREIAGRAYVDDLVSRLRMENVRMSLAPVYLRSTKKVTLTRWSRRKGRRKWSFARKLVATAGITGAVCSAAEGTGATT